MDLGYWWLFPLAIMIATVATGSGIEGATFFAPLFVLGLGLAPATAIGVAIGTEVFGFTSGVIAHSRAGAIDWRMVRYLATASVPAAILGSWVAGIIPEIALRLLLAIGLIVIGYVFIRHEKAESHDHPPVLATINSTRRVVLADRTVHDYDSASPSYGRIGASIGGLLTGLLSTGLGEANSFTLIKKNSVPPRIAVAVSVATVAITAIAAVATHAIEFLSNPDADVALIASILIFTVPGVLIGGQLGPRTIALVKEMTLIRSIGWLFVCIAALTVIG